MTCKLLDPKLTVAVQELGCPPNWIPFFPGGWAVWVDRATFDALKARQHDKPCDICPEEVKRECNDEEKV